jgi:hypothetical protein
VPANRGWLAFVELSQVRESNVFSGEVPTECLGEVAAMVRAS